MAGTIRWSTMASSRVAARVARHAQPLDIKRPGIIDVMRVWGASGSTGGARTRPCQVAGADSLEDGSACCDLVSVLFSLARSVLLHPVLVGVLPRTNSGVVTLAVRLPPLVAALLRSLRVFCRPFKRDSLRALLASRSPAHRVALASMKHLQAHRFAACAATFFHCTHISHRACNHYSA